MKIHVFVHICVLEALAGQTGGEEEVRLNVNVESSMFVVCHTPVEILLILDCLFRLRKEVIHAFVSALCG